MPFGGAGDRFPIDLPLPSSPSAFLWRPFALHAPTRQPVSQPVSLLLLVWFAWPVAPAVRRGPAAPAAELPQFLLFASRSSAQLLRLAVIIGKPREANGNEMSTRREREKEWGCAQIQLNTRCTEHRDPRLPACLSVWFAHVRHGRLPVCLALPWSSCLRLPQYEALLSCLSLPIQTTLTIGAGR